MNFTHLQAFYEVARAGSVSAGAARLHVSQPAVTREIRALESRLGVMLFDRLPRGMLLTDAGIRLHAYAKQIFALADAAKAEIQELAGLTAGDLRIAASATVGVYLVPDMIAHFNARYPAVQVDLAVLNSAQVGEALVAHRAALGFIEGPLDETLFDSQQIGADEIVAVAGAGHPMVGALLQPADLSKHALVLRESGSGTRAVVEDAFARLGLALTPLMSVSNTEAIKRMLVSQRAIAYLSRLSVKDALQRGDLVELHVDGLRIERALHMIWLKGRSFSPSAQAFQTLSVTTLGG